MSDKPGVQPLQNSMYNGYHQRVALGAGTYGPYGLGGPQASFGSMSAIKAALPSPAGTEHPTTASRSSQNNPVMVLPSGQTVPVSAFFPPSDNTPGQLSYHTGGLYNNMINNSHLLQPNLGGCGISYGMTNVVPELDSARRGPIYNSEDSFGMPVTNGGIHQDYCSGFQYPGSVDNQTYVAGPIQPMKTKDNKGYEMVNLDDLVCGDPPIPRAVPALWTNQEDLSLAKCLQNPEGITNIYIRGFMPDTTDDDLHRWASRFGEIESCKAIIEQDTGKCKGFGFVMYYSPASAENCIRGFFHLGFQASYAQKSRNARLKDLEDKASTNIYCTGVPIDWNEADLAKHFLPYHAISTKICRDSPSGVSKEVGFARFETREVAENAIKDFHSVLTEEDGVKLFLRFANTKAQKQLKQQSQERRTWRSREYSYSVEHTPSPTLTRYHNAHDGISPGSYVSPAGASTNFTPATSVSPPEAHNGTQLTKTTITTTRSSGTWPIHGNLQPITNSSVARVQPVSAVASSSHPAIATKVEEKFVKEVRQTKTPSPHKFAIKAEVAAGKENVQSTTPQED